MSAPIAPSPVLSRPTDTDMALGPPETFVSPPFGMRGARFFRVFLLASCIFYWLAGLIMG